MKLRIAYFQHWTLMGSALVEPLLSIPQYELLLVGSNIPSTERDRWLIETTRARRIPLLAPRDLCDESFVKRLREFEPDLVLVVTFSCKIPPEILALPRLAAINMHPAMLPRYRGAAPEFWVLRNGESMTGVSLHHMTDRFDAGRIIAQAPVPIFPTDTLLTLNERMIGPATQILLETLQRYEQGENPPGVEQDTSQVTRAPFVRPHHLAIDWAEPAESIQRLMRACDPVFDANTRFRHQEVIIRQLALAPPLDHTLKPGELFPHRQLERLFVGTGSDPLEILQVKLWHHPTQYGWELVLGQDVQAGERLEYNADRAVLTGANSSCLRPANSALPAP